MSVFTLNQNNNKIDNINISTSDKNNNISSKKDLLMESLIQFFLVTLFLVTFFFLPPDIKLLDTTSSKGRSISLLFATNGAPDNLPPFLGTDAGPHNP